MQYKDYYQLLGLSSSATEDEIRKAYKQMALKYHPDKNPGNPAAEQRFKEISEAKKILLDPNTRFRYDQLRRGGTQSNPATPQEEEETNSLFTTIFEDIFGARRGSRRGKNYEANLSITLEEAYRGMEDVVSFEGRKVRLKIPAGVRHGHTLRVKGQGGPSKSGEPGDVYLTILIKPHSTFTVKGDDLHAELEVSIFDLVLGKKISVPSFRGNMSVVVPPGTQSGEMLKLRGLGMPVFESFDQFGDLYVAVNIRTPKKLSAEERRIWEQLAELEASVGSKR